MPSRDWTEVLRERNFRLFFIGQATSRIGSGMAPVAIAWAVLAHHGTATQLGLVSAAGAAPLVIFLLAGGVIGDRLSRRLVMLSSDALRACSQSALGLWLLVERPPLWVFMVAAALVGTGQAFFNPSLTGLFPQIVSKDHLQQANAVSGLSSSVAGIAGPPIAAVIIAAASPGWAVLVDGLTYVASVISLYFVDLDHTTRTATTSFVAELREGWSQFWSRTWLWVIVLDSALFNVVFAAPMFVLGPSIAKHHLGGATAWALILAAEGVGALCGGLLMVRVRIQRPLLVAAIVGVVWVWPLLTLAFLAPVWLIALGGFFAGASLATFGVLWDTTMQREIPSELLSRLSAYDWFGSLLLLPIGMALVGPISSVLGVRHTFEAAAAVVTLLVAVMVCVPSVVQMRAPAPSPSAVSVE